MGLKQILMLGFILGDLALIIFILNLIGAKSFAYFFVSYLIGLFIWTLLVGYQGGLQPKEWKKQYQKNNKVNFLKGIPLILFITSGFFLIYLGLSPVGVGFIVSLFVVAYMIHFFGDLLHIITKYIEVFDDMLVKKYRWLKK